MYRLNQRIDDSDIDGQWRKWIVGKIVGGILLHEMYAGLYIADAQENTDPKHMRSSS